MLGHDTSSGWVGWYPVVWGTGTGADTSGAPWYGSGASVSLFLRHFREKPEKPEKVVIFVKIQKNPKKWLFSGFSWIFMKYRVFTTFRCRPSAGPVQAQCGPVVVQWWSSVAQWCHWSGLRPHLSKLPKLTAKESHFGQNCQNCQKQ